MCWCCLQGEGQETLEASFILEQAGWPWMTGDDLRAGQAGGLTQAPSLTHCQSRWRYLMFSLHRTVQSSGAEQPTGTLLPRHSAPQGAFEDVCLLPEQAPMGRQALAVLRSKLHPADSSAPHLRRCCRTLSRCQSCSCPLPRRSGSRTSGRRGCRCWAAAAGGDGRGGVLRVKVIATQPCMPTLLQHAVNSGGS